MRPRSRIRSAVAVLVVLAMAALAGACSSSTKVPTSQTTVGPSATTSASTTAPSTTSSTTAPATVQPDTAIWPFASQRPGYPDPLDAARSFAVTYLGFVDPVIGAFQQGDSRSGEVNVQATTTGPVTTVLVRMLTSADTWWVLGASTANIRLESPAALAAVTSPVVLSGQSTAFEATVNVQIRQDGALTPLAEDVVMGGANGEMGPFSKSVTFAHPSAGAGAIVLKTMSARDGNIWEASVIRVSFSA